MQSLTNHQNVTSAAGNGVYYALRIASAMCFIGHGAFGIITKEIWANYFGVFGIGHADAYSLMPVVGIIDILCGLIILFYPMKAFVMWLVVWGFVTALLRPASGEPFPELIERAGNFGAPLALLMLSGGIHLKNIFKPLRPNVHLNADTMASMAVVLRIVVCMLLAGHGWLNMMEKKGIISQYAALGFADPAATAQFVGLFEIFAGLMVLIRPGRWLILMLFIWKMSTELFYPHYEVFEWVERGGSYGSILALWFMTGTAADTKKDAGLKQSLATVVGFNSTSLIFSLFNFKPVFK